MLMELTTCDVPGGPEHIGSEMSSTVNHVVVFVQENHTTDNYFRSMAAWGANVATGWPTATNPPATDHPHDRHAYARWLAAPQAGGTTPGFHAQFDTTAVLPFYAYLAATGAFLENHCSGFGTNSTPNHLLIVGGQTPTLRTPPRSAPQPEWDMPSLPGHAQDHGLSWTCYTGKSGYPVEFYTQLKGSANIVRKDRIGENAANLAALSMVWHDSPFDEHPVADVTLGHNQIWTDVAALAAAGHWDDTVFMLTWDDWGGYDDHVATPNVEHTPDGIQLAFGPRGPLLMLGAPVPACRRWVWPASMTPPASPTSSTHRCPIRRHRPSVPASPSPHHRLPPRHPPHSRHRRPRTPTPSVRSCCVTAQPCRRPTTNPSARPNTLPIATRLNSRDRCGR